jgi:crotonobetainyl-CoA:carnitine CoA-transferase CaiB-like acyl-CoA transferase
MTQESSMAEHGTGPLHGVRVLDLTSTLSGPYCTLLLAQLGADVVKVEPPAGDVVRQIMPGRSEGMSPVFLALNAGKRSLVLDLGSADGRATLKSRLAEVDVVVHNMRPLSAARLGLTQAELAKLNPNAILCEITGYGPGPYEGRPAYDDTIQAMSGLAALQGVVEGRPAYVRSVIADKTAGLTAAVAVLAALTERSRTGAVRAVTVPMFETMAAFTMLEQLGGLTYVPPTGPALYPRTVAANRHPFRTADGYISVMLYTDAHWRRFLKWSGNGELEADPRFATLAGRSANIEVVYGVLERELSSRSTIAWLEVFDELDVPAAPILEIPDLLQHEQVLRGGLVEVVEHPTEGTIRQVRSPILIDGSPLPRVRPAPALGDADGGTPVAPLASSATSVDARRRPEPTTGRCP